MADYWSNWDSRGRYAIMLRVDETERSGSNVKGMAYLYLFGTNGYTFYGHNTYGEIWIDGALHGSFNSKNPNTGWTDSSGILLAAVPWGWTTGGRPIAVRAHYNATGVPSSYGPGNALDASGTFQITPNPTAPPAPKNLRVDTTTNKSVRFMFDSNGDGGSAITGWEAQYSTTSDFSSGNSSWLATSGTITFSNLTSKTRYWIRARGKNAVGTGTAAAPISVMIHGVPERTAAPTVTTAEAARLAGSVSPTTNTWGAAITSQRTEISATEDFATVLATSSESTFNFTGLARVRRYYIRHRVTNTYGDSAWSPTTSRETTGAPPSAPSNYPPYEVASQSVMVPTGSIADNGGAVPDAMRVQVSTTQTDAGIISTQEGDAWVALPVTGLTPDTNYFIRQSAHNSVGGGGWGPYGQWVAVKTKNNVPHSPIVTLGTLTATSAHVHYTINVDLGAQVLAYYVLIGKNKSLTIDARQVNLDPSTFSTIFYDLTPGTQYYARVWCTSSNGAGSRSVLLSFTTPGGTAPTEGGYSWMKIDGVNRRGRFWMKIDGVVRRGRLWMKIDGVNRRAK